MRLSAPTKKVFNASLIIAVLSVVALIVSAFVLTGILTPVAYALMLIAFVLLALGNMLKGF